MPKASPFVRSFNAGVFSVLMEGRTDIDRYPASLREIYNFVTTPQGPVVRRSGTVHVASAMSATTRSALMPFVYASDQALNVELAHNVFRFVDENGVQTYDYVGVTVTGTAPLTVTAALGASVGEQVAFRGFPPQASLNGHIARVVSVSGTTYVFDVSYAAGSYGAYAPEAARVYTVASPYAESAVQSVRFVQSADVMYMFAPGHRPQLLARYGVRDWRLSEFIINDGPYMDVNETGVSLTPSRSTNVATAVNGVASASSEAADHPAAHAMSYDNTQYWASSVNQSGTWTYTPTVPFACDGYVVYVARENNDPNYTSKDRAPGDWTFEGYTGSSWVVLDSKTGYVLYDGLRSAYFKLNSTTVYSAYRVVITACTRNGPIAPRIGQMMLTALGDKSVTLTASGTSGVNGGSGFLSTDVGRLIRARGADGFWRPYRVTSVTSATVIGADCEADPLTSVVPNTEWRLGYWSDTTGWPTCGCFFEDRLWLAGSTSAPDLVVGSLTGGYQTFSQADAYGEVLDDSAVVVRLNARQIGRIRWMTNDERGLLIGTSNGPWVLSANGNGSDPITARNIRAKQSARRGAADVDAVSIDKQVLFIEAARRSLREFAYVYEVDGYKAPSMSQFASHLGAIRFAELAYAAEPHSIVWVRRDDGSVAGLTYNRDENVVGWHVHDFGGEVESITVIPSIDQRQDTLWLVVKRGDRRTIERMAQFWDFGSDVYDAHYVDDGLRYEGPATGTVYGLRHLEGADVVGLADGVSFGPVTVADAAVDLPEEATNVVVGLPFESRFATSRLEAGAADGTAQGKEKRIHGVVLNLWDSSEGEVGVLVDGVPVYDPVPYDEAPYSVIETNALHTGMVGPIAPSPGYGKDGVLLMRAVGEKPLPLNVLSIMPQMHTQDR